MVTRREFLKKSIQGAAACSAFSYFSFCDKTIKQPNVLFIICDDLNDMVENMGGHPKAITPNINRLMDRGVSFMNAHCNSPLCSPSRASLLSGLYPHTSGFYCIRNDEGDHPNWYDNAILKDSQTIMQHFKANGYHVMGTGKIFHNHEEKLDHFHEFGHMPSWGPWPWDGKEEGQGWGAASSYPGNYGSFSIDANYAKLGDVPHIKPDPETGAPGYKGWRLYGEPFKYNGPNDRDLMPDELNARWAGKKLQEKHNKPFLMMVGMNRPHVPLFAPNKYFDMYPLDKIPLTKIKENDLDDIFPEGKDVYRSNTTTWGFMKYDRLTKENRKAALREWTRAYLANVSFVDDQVGKVLDALEDSQYADNTLIIFTSDHGYGLGEKEWLFKNSVWAESTRIPFVAAGPKVKKNKQCNKPISLIDLYPTLIDYCNLPMEPNKNTNGYKLDGNSIVNWFQNPKTAKVDEDDYALTTVGGLNQTEDIEIKRKESHYTLKTKRYRYTRYGFENEELYDHKNDPNEWHNLINDPKYRKVKKRLRKKLNSILSK